MRRPPTRFARARQGPPWTIGRPAGRGPTPAGRQRGATLVEVLVAVLVFTAGVLGLVALQARATQVSIGAEDSARAALLAAEIASTMWNAGTVALPVATVTAWQARVADPAAGGLPSGAGTVVVNAAARTAEVTVTWRATSAATDAPPSRYRTHVVVPPGAM